MHKPSKRSQAVNAYFNSQELFDDLSDIIRQDIIEGKQSYTYEDISVPDKPSLSSFVGYVEEDHRLLKVLEGKLKAAFAEINHVRFGSGNHIVVDTKPNTWLRRTFSGPGNSSGPG